jgi:autotransporter-associated beta strand protein
MAFLTATGGAKAQTLTISTASSSGSGWSISSGTLTVTANSTVNVTDITTAMAGGSLTIVGNTSSFTVNINNAITSTTAGSGLTIGSAGNTGTITVGANLSINGPITIDGGSIVLGGTLTSDQTAAAVTLRSLTHITNTVATTITTQGGNVLFASNVDDAADGESTNNGYIRLMFGLTVTSNGGNITLGGGNSTGTDYATGSNTSGLHSGIRMDAVLNLNSGNGNINMKGKSPALNVEGWGVGFASVTAGATINSGTGTILLDGFSQTYGGDFNSGLYFGSAATITTTNESSNAIQLLGKATGTSGQAWGLEAEGGELSLIASADNGGITISSSMKTNDYDVVFRHNVNILAKSGPIQLLGGQSAGNGNGFFYKSAEFSIGSKASSAVPSSSSNITIQYDRFSYAGGNNPALATSGSVMVRPVSNSFGDNFYTQWFRYNQNGQTMNSLTIGKPGNTLNIYHQTNAITAAGPISFYGGYVQLSANLTSTADGDIILKGISGGYDIEVNNTISKTAGTGTLMIQSNGRIAQFGAITASGTSVLDVVMWSDFDGDNNGGGVSVFGAITTNGGHVWLGGSNSNGGSYIWNGLTVGDGPSIGGSNANAFDLFNNVTTNGGDFFAWAGNGNGGVNGIASNGTWVINTGAGDITFIAPSTSGTIKFTTTGQISLAPNGGSYPGALTFGGSLSSDIFTFNTSYYNGLVINNLSTVGGLTIGKYSGLLSSGTPVNLSNSSNITLSSAHTLACPISLYGGALALNANLTTTGTGDILLNGTTISGTGNLVVAAGRTATINVSSASTFDGIVSGTGSGFTKAGAGVLTLTKDHTYTGATTINGGDLQVGTGGSVSQASSGTISRMNGSTQEGTSGVSVASGAKLILAPNENIVFPASVAGDGGVEIKGMSGTYRNTYLTTTATLLVSNTSVLEVLTRITGGTMGGASASGICAAYQKSYNAATNTGTIQLQQLTTSTLTKVVYVTLEKLNTSDVSIKITGAANKSANVLGQDMTTVTPTAMTVATTAGGTGYGISQVFMSGKVNFTGTLSYTGTTTLSNTVTSGTLPTYSYRSRGTQEITDVSSSFPTGGTVVNDGLVILNRSTPGTISSNMSGTEEVLQVGAAVTMTGTNTYSGLTTIDKDKVLNIGSGGTSGSMTGNMLNYGSLTYDRSDASSYPGVVSGTGTLTKSGTGVLTMSGLNTYSGATTINAGTLIVERDVPASSTSGFSGAGILGIQPSSASFTNAVSYPISGFPTVSNTIGGLTLGKSGNTANISFASFTEASGPITVYGGTVTLGANLTTNTSGDISIYSDNTLSVSTSQTATAAGMFKYMPNGISFASAVSYPVGNLTVSSNGLQLGKPGNTAALTITGASSSNGPVSVFTGDFTTNASATLTATSSALEVTASGNVTLNAALAGSSTTVNVQGNLQTIGTLTNVNLTGGNAQGLTGTATINNLTLNKTVATTATITADRQDLTGTLTLTSGTLAAGGKLVLKSNASGTARVVAHATSTGNVTGNVVVERFIPSTGSRKKQWRMLGFPYSAAITPGDVSGIGISYTGAQTMMLFNETNDNGVYGTTGRNGGYAPLGSATASIPAGRGVATWIYGDNTATPATGTLGTDLTISSQGPLSETGASVSLTGLSNNVQGWHLIGNPFASTIDWHTVLASSTNVASTLYRWDPQFEGWTEYNQSGGSIGANASRYIESGSAFFIKRSTTGPIDVVIPQSAKDANNAPDLHFTKAPFRLNIPGERIGAASILAGLRVKASGMGNPIPAEAYLDVSRVDATKGWDPKYDGWMMSRSAGANIYFDGAADDDFSMQFDAPLTTGEQRYYPLAVTTPAVGETTIEINSEGRWSNMHSVALIDQKLGRTILMQGGEIKYKFKLEELKSEGRFLLAINHIKLDADGKIPGFDVKALGNPVTGNTIDLLLTHPTATAQSWRVIDITGREAGAGTFAKDAGIQHRLTVPGMRNPGVYVVQISMDNGETQQLRILKN